MNQRKPGTWHTNNEQDEQIRRFNEKQERMKQEGYPTEYNPKLYNLYNAFQDEFGVPSKVLYPACGMDITPVISFIKSKVILVDKDKLIIESLNRRGIEALCADATKHQFDGTFDLTILMNPTFRTEDVVHLMSPKGYILANDWHGNTSQMLDESDQYEFLGTYNHDKNPTELLSIQSSRKILAETNPFFNLYSLFRLRI